MNIVGNVFFKIIQFSPRLKRFLWQAWYNYIVNFDQDREFLFMNYGYSGLDESSSPIPLQPSEEVYRLRIQLYHHVASGASLAGKEVLEVGCGCGGGAAYVASHFGPALYKGLDYSQKAVEACRKYHAAVPNLTFIHGDAEDLPFGDAAFDVVINVESSHTYGNTDRFFSEVNRVLRPGGHFLFADFRMKNEVPALRNQLLDARFQILHDEDITRNIVRALELDHDRKTGLIERNGQGIFKKSFQSFSGTKDSITFKTFESGEMEYRYFILNRTIS